MKRVKKSTTKKSSVKKKRAVTKKKTVTRKSTAKKKKPVVKKKVGKPVNRPGSNKTLALEPVLVINDAEVMYTRLKEILVDDKPVIIDASMVEMVDTAILQLLLAFVNQLHANNTEVLWDSPSSEFCNRVDTLGLVDSLGLGGACGQ